MENEYVLQKTYEDEEVSKSSSVKSIVNTTEMSTQTDPVEADALIKPMNDEIVMIVKQHFAKILNKNNPKTLGDFESKMK